jgi:hypothetical protein
MRRLLLLSTVLVLTACGADPGPAEPAADATLGPAAAQAPDTRRVACDLGRTTVVLDLPAAATGAAEQSDLDESCGWGVPGRWAGVSVTDEPDAGIDEQYEDRSEFLGVGGDDEITELTLDEDVPTFGGAIGDRMFAACYCDGVPEVTYVVEAAGVQLTLTVPERRRATAAAWLETTLATAGTR